MRYGELVQFEPIETVVQLQEADEEAAARRLVETYVISERMAEQFTGVVIPQLQFLRPSDNKGVLVVGNYGTGKSHLMSVVSAVAEYPGLAERLSHPHVREAAEAIAGRFRVVRVEIGAVQRGLRDILIDELEQALDRWGTPFTFPPASQLTNHKDILVEAVAAFQERYPDHGILLVVDELLDYLRGREERALILDLGFLRELGEVAALTPFRFMGGLQETLFDSPRFAFVAEPLRRVRDRFELVRIARQDIAFVVANRLLKKSDQQLAWISEHLRPFTPLYAQMAERLEEFARLFPIHPAYIEAFEQVHVAEKREVLRTFSHAIHRLLDQDVPTDQPGLVAYDHYWSVLRDNPSMRGLPNVAEVIEKSAVLEGRIVNAYTRPNLRPMALRIVHGLSVLRLTTDDIHAPLGATPVELRDNLCLWTAMPERTADFLLDQVRVALREIEKTVSGQYITYNEANDQYYLDVRKDIDFDAKIRERGEFLSRADLNPYFFDALRQVLGLSDTTYLTGTLLWFYELPWAERKVTRPGYLFFRPPDERTTAQPPRDFLLYVLPPFTERPWRGDSQPDEIVFRLSGVGQKFEDLVRRYAGARAMGNESASHREIYNGMADDALRRLRQWLNEHLYDHLQVTYQSVTQPVGQAFAGAHSTARRDLAELIQNVGAAKLAPLFAETYPEYPAFSRLNQPVTEESRSGTAAEAIRVLAGRTRTNQGTAVLEALGLVDGGGTIRPSGSSYARHFLERLREKPEGQVVNRGEVIEQVAGGLQPIEKDLRFGLEPEWVAVLLVGLVYAGEIALSLDGREALEAATIDRAAMLDVKELANFRFYKQPKSLPVGLWSEIFENLGLQAALIRDENLATREQGIRELQRAIQHELDRVVALQATLAQGVRLWNTPVFTDNFTLECERGAVVGSNLPEVAVTSAASQAALRGYKAYLEKLQRFNSVGKLRNLDLSAAEISAARDHRQAVDQLEALLRLVAQLQPVSAYLAEAQANLPADHPWSQQAAQVKQRLLDEVRCLAKGEGPPPAPMHELEALKRGYIGAYSAEHARLTLGPKADDRRASLTRDPRLAALRELSKIDLLDKAQLSGWQIAITDLPTCREFHEGIIAEMPTCPNCRLRPSQRARGRSAEQTIDFLDRRLDTMLTDWRRALFNALESEPATKSIEAMTATERGPITEFLAQRGDECDVPAGFAQAATLALRGIQTVAIWPGDLLEALALGGLPCTRPELQSRFAAFLDEHMRGKDHNTTRLTLAERELALAAD